jgi:hypothetical protein
MALQRYIDLEKVVGKKQDAPSFDAPRGVKMLGQLDCLLRFAIAFPR